MWRIIIIFPDYMIVFLKCNSRLNQVLTLCNSGQKLSEQEIDEMMQDADFDKDGKISYQGNFINTLVIRPFLFYYLLV